MHRLLLTAVLVGAVTGCDSGDPEVLDLTTVEVSVTYPDGTAVPARVTLAEPLQRRPDGTLVNPDPFSVTVGTTTGGVVFEGVPPGTHQLVVEPLPNSSGYPDQRVQSMYLETVQVTAGGGPVRVQAYLGVTHLYNFPQLGGDTTTDRTLSLQGPASEGGRSAGVAYLLRLNPSSLHVGAGIDLVEWVRPLNPLHVYDNRATSATVEVYRVPEGVPWPSEALTYDTFSALTPAARYTVPLSPVGSPAYPYNRGCLDLDFDPALFFNASNGIAVVVRGESVWDEGEFPSAVHVGYRWPGGVAQNAEVQRCMPDGA